MEKANVYFTKEITKESLVKIYNYLEKKLDGKIAVKISTGEKGNNNYLKPDLIKDLVKYLNGTIVECNTAYQGSRNTTEAHLETIKEHGFTEIADVDIMDSEGDFPIQVVNGKHLKENYVGKNLQNYDSILMLSHFKGHPMGGFGGALKNMSIGIASSRGKSLIHTAGKEEIGYGPDTPQTKFIESMADADKSVIDYMKGNIVYINVINNLSVDCDCVAHPKDVCMKDIGIVASTDPVALDKACIDLIYNSEDPGKKHLIERIESRGGTHIINASKNLNIGTDEYNFINIDN